jgi:uncharacterized membrane protein
VLRTVAWIVLLTLAPTLELRASIPYGIINGEFPTWLVVAMCVVVNILLAPIVWVFLDRGIHIFLRVRWIKDLYEKLVIRARDNLHPYVERWGVLGLALFIGVPLPGSGVYSGALGAYLLGFRFRQYMLAAAMGVMIAAAAVTAVMVSGSGALQLFIKH